VLVRHLGSWSLNRCQVVYRIAGDDSPEFGFAYGTLTNHAEIAEEIFKVSLRPDTGEGVACDLRRLKAALRIGETRLPCDTFAPSSFPSRFRRGPWFAR
jgi:uncharacterized protein (UPF0548 family)